MVDRFTTEPIELPPADRPFQRADLLFYGLDHSGASFFILGHDGCFGDAGNCDLPARSDTFDLRPAHQLEPALRILTVTDAMQSLLERGVGTAKVTVVAHTEGRTPNDVLAFERVRLATYA